MTDRSVSVRMTANVSDYMAKFSAAGKATEDLANKVDKAKGRTAAGFQTIGRTAIVAGGAVAVGFVLAGKEAKSFQSRMALVQTLARASSADMKLLQGAALTVGTAYGYTADQVADAEAELVKAGVSVKDIIGGALTGALTLAAAGQTDVAEATQTAAIAMTQFKLSGKDVPHIADLLAAGADKALGSVADLSEGLQSGGLSAAQMGLSIDDTVATLAEFAQSGLLAEKGGTVLRQMFIKLAAPSAAASAEMKKLGIAAFDSDGKFVGMAKLAGELQAKLEPLSAAQRNQALATIFGARAIQGANILVKDGAAGWEDWRKKVDDSGFAALQTAGKMNSLSGDITKFHAAFDSAMIGVGEGEQGPLRHLVQTGTDVIRVWTEMPGPVRDGAEALVAVTGAAALAGGAAMLAIPKWSAMNAALASTKFGAISASRALKGLGTASAVVAGITAVYEGVNALNKALAPTAPSVNGLTDSLVDFANKGVLTGTLVKAFGSDLSDMGAEAKRIVDRGTMDTLADKLDIFHRRPGRSSIVEATSDFQSLDKALAGLVTSGHLDMARKGFDEVQQVLGAAGLSTKQITSLFPQFGVALSDSATQAKKAGTGVDSYGNAVSAAAQKTASATDAAKSYSDALHAQADPLFAMNQALQDLHDKQKTVTDDIKKYGANSSQVKQAQLDVASSALDAAAAAKTLAASVKDGTTSLSGAKQMLHEWVAAGIITKSEAQQIASSFGGIIDKADHIASALDRSAAAAKKGGFTIGKSLADGITTGIEQGQGQVELVTEKLVNGVLHVAHTTADAHSPSRKTMKLGADIADGLSAGFLAQNPKVIAAFEKGTSQGLSAIASVVSAAQSKLSSDLSARASAVSSISSSLAGNFALTNAFGPYGNVLNLSSFLGGGKAQLHTEKSLLDRLAAKHLAPGLIADIAGASPQQGIALATSILSGASGKIATINADYAGINKYATSIGTLATSAQYNATIAHDRAMLATAQRQERLLQDIVTALGKGKPKEIGAAVAAALENLIRGQQVHGKR